MTHSPKDIHDTAWPDALLSQQDLQLLGLNNIGYIRTAQIRGEIAFVLHAADGTALAVRHDADDIKNLATEQAIGIASLH